MCRFTPAGTRGKSARRMPDTVPCFGAFRRTVPGGGNAMSFAGRWPFRFLHLFLISAGFLSFGPVRNRSGVHETGKRGGRSYANDRDGPAEDDDGTHGSGKCRGGGFFFVRPTGAARRAKAGRLASPVSIAGPSAAKPADGPGKHGASPDLSSVSRTIAA